MNNLLLEASKKLPQNLNISVNSEIDLINSIKSKTHQEQEKIVYQLSEILNKEGISKSKQYIYLKGLIKEGVIDNLDMCNIMIIKSDYKRAEYFCNLNNDAKSCFYLGLLYQKQKKYKEAIEYYEKAIELGDDSIKGMACYNLGVVYYKKGEYEKAIEYYEKAIELGDDNIKSKAYNKLGITFSQGEYKKAIEYYEKAIELGDDDNKGMACHNLGVVYYKKGEYKKAIEYYEKAIELGDDGTKGSAYSNLFEVYIIDGIQNNKTGYEKAIELHKAVINLYSDNNLNNIIRPDFYRHLASAYILYQRYEEADKCIQNSQDLQELTNPEPFGWGWYKNHIMDYKKNIKLGDKNTKGIAHYNLGVIFYETINHKQAIEYYEKAIELGDDDTKGASYNNLGVIFSDKGKNKEAIEYYEKAIELGDDNTKGSAYNNLGTLYTKKYRKQEIKELYEKVIEYHENAIKLSTDNSIKGKVYFNLCRASIDRYKYNEKLGYKNRIKYYEKIIELGDNQLKQDAHVLLSHIGRFTEKIYTQVIEAYKKSIESGDEQLKTNIHNIFSSRMYIGEENYEEVIKLHKEAINLYQCEKSNNKLKLKLYNNLILIYILDGKYEEANKYLKISQELNKNQIDG